MMIHSWSEIKQTLRSISLEPPFRLPSSVSCVDEGLAIGSAAERKDRAPIESVLCLSVDVRASRVRSEPGPLILFLDFPTQKIDTRPNKFSLQVEVSKLRIIAISFEISRF